MPTNPQSHIDQLRNFDYLPDSALVRQPVLEALFGIAPNTVHKWVKDGSLPQPRVRKPRYSAWLVGDIRTTQKNQQKC
jgi:predicted DNA-binding transcriptional regulator AlpA